MIRRPHHPPWKSPLGKRSRQRKIQRSERESALQQSAVAATLQQARTLHTGGRLTDAEALYRDLLRKVPDHPEALHLLGVIRLQRGDAEQAVSLMLRASSLAPDNAPTQANLGSALLTLRRWEEALARYDQALRLNPKFVGVYHNRGTALQMLGRHTEAAQCFERLRESMPEGDFVLGNLCHSRGYVCDWRGFDTDAPALVSAVRAGRRAARPFGFLAVSASGAEQLQCARTYCAQAVPSIPTPLWNGVRYEHDRIRIAYVSADFRDHVVSHLMAPIYEGHDSRRFQTIGIGVAAGDESAVAVRARRSLEQFVDAAGLSDADVAKKLCELEVDIAIDLTGYTLGGRPGIFAYRPAAVQVSYLGYPGTTGASYMDYVLADPYVIPPASQSFHTEKAVYLPETFQANDERRSVMAGGTAPRSRATLGLAEETIVLCCFNNSYKLNPPLFEAWMSVLRMVPATVLWLLATEPGMEARLRDEALRRGIPATRLIFAPRVPYEEHLARLSHADLYLDTVPFNGGASTSDALWAGVPVVTCAGEAFAARMSGSLLSAVGLPELITNSLDGYTDMVRDLATDVNRLAQYKARLLRQRGNTALFDAQRFCRHLELAYQGMWERSQRGQPPASFAVEPLPVGASAGIAP